MAFTLTHVRPLLNATELALFQLSRRGAIGELTASQLQAKIARTRALRDKYRDVYRRQTVDTRSGPARKRAHFGGENDRTERKAAIMAEVLTRFEERLEKVQAKTPPSPPQPRYPAPGAKATTSSAPSPAERMRRPAKDAVPAGPADKPMRGATETGQRAIARKDRAALAAAEDVVAARATKARTARNEATAAKPARKQAAAKTASKTASTKASTRPTASRKSASGVTLQDAVKEALQAKQAAPVSAGPRRAARRGAADPSLAVAPTDVPAVAEHRLDPLKARPENKKIHASARGRKKVFQAQRDSR